VDQSTPNRHEASGVAGERTPRKRLLLILLLGLALRIVSLTATMAKPDFQWVDADHYMTLGQDVASVPRPLAERVVRAASYKYIDATFYLPPAYTLALALFALFPHYPLNAAIGQSVLGAIGAVFVFAIARRLHSTRAALIAAALYAAWPPAISGVNLFVQEQLYIPLLLAAFALLASVVERDRPWGHFVTGVVFGLAALTRLMILFYFVLVPVLIWLASRDTKSIRRQIVPLVLGAAIVVLPYSVFISWMTGQVMLVENHGAFDMTKYAENAVATAPTLGVGLQVLLEEITHKPLVFLGNWLDYVRLLFKPNGLQWSEWFAMYSTRLVAFLGVGVRLLYDGLFLAVIGLTPLGILLARRRRLAVLLAAWVLVLTLCTALTGTAGTRYRSPAEPVLLTFATIGVAGPWRHRARGSLLVAAGVGAALVVPLAAQVPAPAALPAYGLQSWSPEQGAGESTRRADVGFRLISATTIADLVIQPTVPLAEGTRVEVTVDGHVVFDGMTSDGQPVRLGWVRESTPYLRIRVTGGRSGRPIPFRFTILRRSTSRVVEAESAGTRAP